MKLHYFDQRTADRDDALLAELKRQGVVPPTCLLGGSMVESHHLAGRDPCETCPGPRKNCKGRPRKTEPASSIEDEKVAAKIMSESSEVIRMRQLEKAKKLRVLLEEAFKA